MRFKSREEAAKQLAVALQKYKGASDSIVVALPRGGVPLGAVLARELELPLDIFFVKKIPSPYNEEVAVGAVSENGLLYLNQKAITMLGISQEYIHNKTKEILKKMHEKRALYQKPSFDYKNKTILLVDDGIATGASFILAIKALKALGAKRVIAIAPVAPSDVAQELEEIANEVVIIRKDPYFMAVGAYYDDFHQLSDSEVQEILKQF